MTSSRTFSCGFGERGRILTLALVLSLSSGGWLGAGAASAGELGISGAIEAEARSFLNEPAFAGQLDGEQLSLVLAPELGYRSADGRHQFRFAPYLRLDSEDDERTHADLRQASWRFIGDRWETLVGLDRVFWGVTESRHLVDIVNQTDGVEDTDEEDKLGQPMIAVTHQRSWGSLSLYLLPGFRERTFPGREGRARTPLVVDTDRAGYESGAEDTRLDVALRWSHYLGDWDLGASYFHGTSREPRLLPSAGSSPDDLRLVPFYDVIQQVGIDVQKTTGAWLLKLEALARKGQGRTFGAAVAGFEYTLYQIQAGADLGLLLEYLWDDRDPDPSVAPVTPFDDDVFLGARLAINDVQDTQLLLGGIVDREERTWAGLIEAERRLTDHFKLVLESRFFPGGDASDPLTAFGQDDFVTLRILYSF